METVNSLISQINEKRNGKVSSSAKDEVLVMQAMLNDSTFVVDVYGKNGVEGQYCPYTESRNMIGSIIKDATRISAEEASRIANDYEFGKKESETMVTLSKQFINTYLETGRKLPLGGTANSNISISKKTKPEREYNAKIGINDDGSDKTSPCVVPSHGTIKVYSSCPKWVK